MHDAPSEASILRSMYETEVAHNIGLREELDKLQLLAKIFIETDDDYNHLAHPERLNARDLERARAAFRDALPRGVSKRE